MRGTLHRINRFECKVPLGFEVYHMENKECAMRLEGTEDAIPSIDQHGAQNPEGYREGEMRPNMDSGQCGFKDSRLLR